MSGGLLVAVFTAVLKYVDRYLDFRKEAKVNLKVARSEFRESQRLAVIRFLHAIERANHEHTIEMNRLDAEFREDLVKHAEGQSDNDFSTYVKFKMAVDELDLSLWAPIVRESLSEIKELLREIYNSAWRQKEMIDSGQKVRPATYINFPLLEQATNSILDSTIREFSESEPV